MVSASASSSSSLLTPSRNANVRKGKIGHGDRYISIRAADAQSPEWQRSWGNVQQAGTSQQSSVVNDYSPATILEQNEKRRLMKVQTSFDKVINCRKKLMPITNICAYGRGDPYSVLHSIHQPAVDVTRSRRYVSKSPDRILDAPGIRDDYYTSLTDWSSINMVAVALTQSIYLWHVNKSDVDMLVEFDEAGPFPTMVRFSCCGKYLSVGLSDGRLEIYDVRSRTLLRTIRSQPNRIANGCWSRKGLLSYGTRSGLVYHHDVRQRDSNIGLFDSHSGAEVCGLRWSDDERYLTSGGADAIVNVWEQAQIIEERTRPLWSFTHHSASVKAIAYVPFLGGGGLGPGGGSTMVATGGGTDDQSVRIWNLDNGSSHSTIQTESQVTGIVFNRHFKEMITGHGNPQPGVRLWHYEPERGLFHYTADMKMSGGRILGLCQSPCAQHVLAICEDETLRLWHCWKVEEKPSKKPRVRLMHRLPV